MRDEPEPAPPALALLSFDLPFFYPETLFLACYFFAIISSSSHLSSKRAGAKARLRFLYTPPPSFFSCRSPHYFPILGTQRFKKGCVFLAQTAEKLGAAKTENGLFFAAFALLWEYWAAWAESYFIDAFRFCAFFPSFVSALCVLRGVAFYDVTIYDWARSDGSGKGILRKAQLRPFCGVGRVGVPVRQAPGLQ